MEIPHDRFIDYKDLLMEKCNIWRDELLTRTVGWKQAEIEKRRDPKKMLMNQNGRPVSISQVVEARKGMVREALQQIKAIQELLDAVEKGVLEDNWTEDALREGVVFDGVSIPVRKEE